MTIATMRQIDRFAGIPFCWLTGIIGMARRRKSAESVESILVIKFFGLGSVLLTAPVLHRLRVGYPSANIIFLSFYGNGELLNEIQLIDDRWLIDPRTPVSFLKTFARVVRLLIRSRIDVVIDLEFFSKFSTFVGAIARPARHIGFALPTRWRSWNLTDSVLLSTNQHVSRTFLDCLRPLGILESGPSLPQIRIKPSSSATTLPFSIESKGQIICVNPNAGRTSLERRWSSLRFAQTIDALSAEDSELTFCLIGSAEERAYVDGIIRQTSKPRDNVLNFAGVLSLKQLFSLFERSMLLITNDSGPMHIAAAIGLPTVALFGPESPRFYGPIGNKTINLSADLSCSPCLSSYNAKSFHCPFDAKCMKEISVNQVVLAARSLLTEPAARRQSERVSL